MKPARVREDAPIAEMIASSIPATASSRTVSYTHLDVYKRQVHHWTTGLTPAPFNLDWFQYHQGRGFGRGFGACSRFSRLRLNRFRQSIHMLLVDGTVRVAGRVRTSNVYAISVIVGNSAGLRQVICSKTDSGVCGCASQRRTTRESEFQATL